MNVEPLLAAQLADEAYNVQDEARFKLFLARPEFSLNKADKRLLRAQVGFRLINATDGFGLCAVGGAEYSNDIFLIFRGSTKANYFADWVNNARFGLERSNTGSLVHIGFNHIFSSMFVELKEFMDRNPHATGTIHCIGHSLGGAIATLAADWLKAHRSNPVKLYTFGAPRVGLYIFAKQLTSKMNSPNVYRVYHENDVVSMIPVFPFVHAPVPGEGYPIPFGKGFTPKKAHSVRQYVSSARDCSWLKLKGRPNPMLGEQALADWLESDDPVNAADPTLWERLSAALAWVVGKLGTAAIAAVQMPFMGALTLADRLAYLLQQGIDLSKEVSFWVYRLIRRMMQLLGMTVAKTAADLTRDLIRWVLSRIIDRMVSQAQRAIRRLSGD